MPYKDPAKNRENNRVYRLKHGEELKHNKAEWAKQDRLKNPDKYRDKGLHASYGPEAPEHFKTQMEKQDSKCAICQEAFIATPHQDHRHLPFKLRGALCRRCNTGLHYLENLDWRNLAEQYLKDWN